MGYLHEQLEQIKNIKDEQERKEAYEKYLKEIGKRDKHIKTADCMIYILEQYKTGYLNIPEEDWKFIDSIVDKIFRNRIKNVNQEKESEENER